MRLSGSAIGRKLIVAGRGYSVTCLSVGNPHCVIFGNMPQAVESRGEAIARCGLFPQGVNVEFAEPVSSREIRARVCERGSGETLSCGSGACAIAAAAVVNGYAREGEDIFIRLRGGTLVVRYTKERVLLSGDVALAFEGVVEV